MDVTLVGVLLEVTLNLFPSQILWKRMGSYRNAGVGVGRNHSGAGQTSGSERAGWAAGAEGASLGTCGRCGTRAACKD